MAEHKSFYCVGGVQVVGVWVCGWVGGCVGGRVAGWLGVGK